MATLAIEVSSASMNVAKVTVRAMTQGLARGRHVSWNESVAAAAAKAAPFPPALERPWCGWCFEQSNGSWLEIPQGGRGGYGCVMLVRSCQPVLQLRVLEMKALCLESIRVGLWVQWPWGECHRMRLRFWGRRSWRGAVI